MKRLFALILSLVLLFPVFSCAGQVDGDLPFDEETEDLDLDEDFSFDEEGNLLLRDEETGETYSLSAFNEEGTGCYQTRDLCVQELSRALVPDPVFTSIPVSVIELGG